MKKPAIFGLTLVVLLIGVWLYYDSQEQKRELRAQQPAQKKAQRIEQQATNPVLPTITSWGLEEGTFIQIDHSVPMLPGSDYMETRRCYVWRDKVTSTSTMSCESEPLLSTGN